MRISEGTYLVRATMVLALLGSSANAALAQGGAPAQPAEPVPPAPEQPTEEEAPTPPTPPTPPVAPEPPAPPVPVEPMSAVAAEPESEFVELRIHIITSSNVYDDLKFDVYDVATKQVAGRGQGANEAIGEAVVTLELQPGVYKIVKAGRSFDTTIDFATVSLTEDTDFLIVLDADSGAFRGSGIVTGELPKGLKIAGVRFALNVGGSLWMNQKRSVVGGTNGVSALVGVFSNFGMVYDKGPHFLTVDAKLQLNLQNAPTSSVFASTDFLEAGALYAFNINNDYVGPYARASLKTRVFPGYLYLESEEVGSGEVTVNRLDGSSETFPFGSEANADDLRIEVAKSFAPLILQEEIGANLKAVSLDLKLLELSVGTRLGWGFRQGITNGLYVVQGDERGGAVTLNEVDDYTTTGPLAGATANITFARWLFGQAEIGALLPIQDSDRAGSSVAKRVLLDASGTAGLKFPALTSKLYASFDYTFRLQRDGYLTTRTMFDQIIMARMSLQLF